MILCPECGTEINKPLIDKGLRVWFCSLQCLEDYSQRKFKEELNQTKEDGK
jgi:hypothetical protein